MHSIGMYERVLKKLNKNKNTEIFNERVVPTLIFMK